MSATVRVERPSPGWFALAGQAGRIVADGLPYIRVPFGVMLGILRIPRVLKGMVALTLIVAFLAFVRVAEDHLMEMEAFRVDPGCMKIREMPPWLDPNWADSIRNPFMSRRSVNLFEPHLTTQVYDAYRESPWIEDVCAVRKEFPNRLRIRIRIRTPLAAVPFGRNYLLVDGHGVLLPRSFSEVPDFGFPLRVIEGVREAPPEPGRRWDSAGLLAGLQVAAVLTASKKKAFDRIVKIDVSLVRTEETAGRTEILLHAAEGGGPIEWGSAPGHRTSLEIPLEKKLANLELLLLKCTDMRAIKYGYIQFDEPVLRPRK